MGFSIVGIEIGYLVFYRSGWSLSIGPIFSYLLVSLILIVIGFMFYREKMLPSNYIGVALAMVSIYLMTRE